MVASAQDKEVSRHSIQAARAQMNDGSRATNDAQSIVEQAKAGFAMKEARDKEQDEAVMELAIELAEERTLHQKLIEAAKPVVEHFYDFRNVTTNQRIAEMDALKKALEQVEK